MQKYIQDSINNNLRSIVSDCTIPQSKAVTEVVRGLFTGGEPILRSLVQYDDISLKKQAEKYSHHLGNIAITEKVDEAAFRKAKRNLRKDSIIAYDLSDIEKEYAKKMEHIHGIWDGSKQRHSTGFMLHGVGMNNMLLKLQVHDAHTKTLPQVRAEILHNLVPKLEGNGIWVFDRGNDSKGFFQELLQISNIRFIVRLKENRYVIDSKTGEYLAIKDMKAGHYQIYLLDHHNYNIDRRIGILTLVIYEHLEEKEPIRLLTNLQRNTYGTTQIVSMYLDRWGIENIFKRAKVKFNLEKIRVLKYQKFVNLVALIQFAVNVSNILYISIQDKTNVLIIGVILLYKRYLKKRVVTFNIDSFISFMQSSLKPLQKHVPRPPPMQLRLLSDRQLF